MKDKKNIAFVSISSDMYGSSKVLLSLVLQMKKHDENFHPIVCIPLEDGPFKEVLKNEGVQMIEMPVVKLTRSMLRSFNIIGLFRQYYRAKKIFRRHTKGITIHAIQSNTLATLFGAFYCFFRKPKHLVHIHEIIDRPKMASIFFKYVLRFFSDHIVYNSKATEDFYHKLSPSFERKSSTIINGVDRSGVDLPGHEITKIRSQLFESGADNVLIGLVGRINRLKGHHLLLESFLSVSEKYSNARLCFIGSPPPNQEFYLTNLQTEVVNSKVSDKVKFVDFQEDIFSILESLDMVIVPSTEPESFGLIVVEAMLAKKAVIGSNIGGIATIIEDRKTGLLFEPKNGKALTRAILELIENPGFKRKLEANAYQKSVDTYSIHSMYLKFNSLYQKTL